MRRADVTGPVRCGDPGHMTLYKCLDATVRARGKGDLTQLPQNNRKESNHSQILKRRFLAQGKRWHSSSSRTEMISTIRETT